ncbi:MAG: L,D-transpeptidase [Anaerolineae bacterium]|nr:L,D-transpeptidase [Anaerolineae bacterium]
MQRPTLYLFLLAILATFAGGVFAQDDSCTSDCTTETYGLTAAQLESIEKISLQYLEPNQSLMHDRRYMSVTGTTAVYDAPGGNIIRTIDQGFNYVTALEDANGWTRINGDEWVESANLTDVSWNVSSFTGILLPEEMPTDYTIAWALVNMYPSKTPGGTPSESYDLIYRYTELHIFATEIADGYRWYQIGPDQWVHQHRVAKVLPLQEIPEDVTTEQWVSIDLYEQVLIAYENNRPVFATLISTGLDRWPTYEGTFRIYYRARREFMSWGTVGDDYYSLEEVPWTMYFDDGRALHGAYWHDGFGYRRSHGCVNMTITDAYWLYQWVAEMMGSQASPDIEEGPFVYVYFSDTYQ